MATAPRSTSSSGLAKAVAPLAVALVLVAAAPAARAVPLGKRPAGPGVRYFGYWGSAAQGVGEAQFGNLPPGVDNPDPGCRADKATGYTRCIEDHANVTHITFGIGQEDWALARLQEAADLRMGVVLTVWNYFFKSRAGSSRQVDLVDGYEAAWTRFLSRIEEPYIKRSHTIVAFYIYDEPSVDAQTIASLGAVAKLLARTAPEVHRWVTFTAKDVDDGAFVIPADVDWVSYDCYAVDGGSPSFNQCAPTYDGYEYGSLSYYRSRLKELIKKTPNYHPSLVLIPQAFLPPGATNLQNDLIARLGPEIAMAERDPDYVMIMPFLWQAVTSLPSVRRFLRSEGARITGGAPPSDDEAGVAAAAAMPRTEAPLLRLQPPFALEPGSVSRLLPPLQLRLSVDGREDLAVVQTGDPGAWPPVPPVCPAVVDGATGSRCPRSSPSRGWP